MHITRSCNRKPHNTACSCPLRKHTERVGGGARRGETRRHRALMTRSHQILMFRPEPAASLFTWLRDYKKANAKPCSPYMRDFPYTFNCSPPTRTQRLSGAPPVPPHLIIAITTATTATPVKQRRRRPFRHDPLRAASAVAVAVALEPASLLD